MLPKCVISLFLPIHKAYQREVFSKVWPNRREHRGNIRPDCKMDSKGILIPPLPCKLRGAMLTRNSLRAWLGQHLQSRLRTNAGRGRDGRRARAAAANSAERDASDPRQ